MLNSTWKRLSPYLLLLLLILVAIIYIYVIFCLFGLLNHVKYGEVFTFSSFVGEIYSLESESIFAALLFPFYSLVACWGLAKVKWLRHRKLFYYLTCWIMSIILIVIISSFGGGPSSWEGMIRILVFSLYSFGLSWGVQQWMVKVS
jgi:hypothetical protein